MCTKQTYTSTYHLIKYLINIIKFKTVYIIKFYLTFTTIPSGPSSHTGVSLVQNNTVAVLTRCQPIGKSVLVLTVKVKNIKIYINIDFQK